MDTVLVQLRGSGADEPFTVQAPLGSTDVELAPLIASELGLAPNAKLCLPSPRPAAGLPWTVHTADATTSATTPATGSNDDDDNIASLHRRIASLLAENASLKQQLPQLPQQQQSPPSPPMMVHSPSKATGHSTNSSSRANAVSPSVMPPSPDATFSSNPLAVDVRLLTGGALGAMTSLAALLAGKYAVLDFWTTRWPSCPEAVRTLQMHSDAPRFSGLRATGKIAFVTVNTDLADKAATLVPTAGSGATHVALAPELKAPLIAHFGIKRVPHHVLLGPDGAVLMNGAAFSWAALDAMVGLVDAAPKAAAPKAPAAAAAAAPSAPSFSFDDDDF